MVCYEIKLWEPIQIEMEAFTCPNQKHLTVTALHFTQSATGVGDSTTVFILPLYQQCSNAHRTGVSNNMNACLSKCALAT